MTRLLLEGYKPIKRRWPVYELDIETGQVETNWFASQADWNSGPPRCGMGDVRRIGALGSRHDAFVALFAYNGALHLWLDGQDIDLAVHDVVVTRKTDLLLRKHFSVEVDKRVVFECRYSYLDYEDFPDEDIFWAMTRNLVDAEHRHRLRLLLEDKLTGMNQSTEGYFKNLEDRLRSSAVARAEHGP